MEGWARGYSAGQLCVGGVYYDSGYDPDATSIDDDLAEQINTDFGMALNLFTGFRNGQTVWYLKVQSLHVGSSAADAGFRQGDRILKILDTKLWLTSKQATSESEAKTRLITRLRSAMRSLAESGSPEIGVRVNELHSNGKYKSQSVVKAIEISGDA